MGGSYFLGKHFVNLSAKNNEVTIFTRGNNPLGLSNIKEIVGDRNKEEDLRQLKDKNFDIVVDFCAYNPKDIENVIKTFDTKIKQYIFISTVDVYKKGTNKIITEQSPLETTVYEGEVGKYILGKVALEKELSECCKKENIAFTSLRPVFIYGVDNYAPRENIFFNWIEKAGQVLFPENADGYFQMIYVDDLAEIINNVCGNKDYYNKAINICGEGIYTYETFLEELRKGCNKDFQKIPISVKDIIAQGIPLPFPLTVEESEHYSSNETDLEKFYRTKLSDGLNKAYDALYGLN